MFFREADLDAGRVRGIDEAGAFQRRGRLAPREALPIDGEAFRVGHLAGFGTHDPIIDRRPPENEAALGDGDGLIGMPVALRGRATGEGERDQERGNEDRGSHRFRGLLLEG